MSLPRRALAMGALTALALTAGLAAPALAARPPGAQHGKGGCPPGVDPRSAFCLPSGEQVRSKPMLPRMGPCPGMDPRLMVACTFPGDHGRARPEDWSRRRPRPRKPEGMRPFDDWGGAFPNPGPLPPRWRPY